MVGSVHGCWLTALAQGMPMNWPGAQRTTASSTSRGRRPDRSVRRPGITAAYPTRCVVSGSRCSPGSQSPDEHPLSVRRLASPRRSRLPSPEQTVSDHPESLDLVLEPADNERLRNVSWPARRAPAPSSGVSASINNRGNSSSAWRGGCDHRRARGPAGLYRASAQEALTPAGVHLFLQESGIDALLEDARRGARVC